MILEGLSIIEFFFFKMHIKEQFQIFLVTKEILPIELAHVARKMGPNFCANDHVLNFCKYRQNSK